MERFLTDKEIVILIFLEIVCMYIAIKYFDYCRGSIAWFIILYTILNDNIKMHFKTYILLWILMNLFYYKKK